MSRFVVLWAVFFLTVSNVAAIPISEYHQNLEYAINDVELLLEREENESDTDYENRFAANLDGIREHLPKNQVVELEKATWAVDNDWLHTKLDELQRAPASERFEKLTSLLEALRAVDERVNDLEQAQKVESNKATAQQKMDEILARSEYVAGARGPNALTRLIRDFIRWLEELLPKPPEVAPGRSNFVGVIVRILVVIMASALILYVLRLLFIRFKRPPKAKTRKKREPRIVLGERLQPEDTATDLLAEAEALARNGDLRAAIRKGYIALLVELGDRKLISLAQYKTNRDYLGSVSNLPQLHSRLKGLTESFERHWYGFAQATPNDWQDFRTGYREALQTGN